MRKRLLLSLGLLACLAASVVVRWLTAGNPRVNETTFAKIEQGMTPQEVEDFLGEPGTAVRTGPLPDYDSMDINS